MYEYTHIHMYIYINIYTDTHTHTHGSTATGDKRVFLKPVTASEMGNVKASEGKTA